MDATEERSVFLAKVGRTTRPHLAGIAFLLGPVFLALSAAPLAVHFAPLVTQHALTFPRQAIGSLGCR
jgi:hypothetical protein